jgi:hypothetical protein
MEDKESMTKTRVFQFAALALVLAFGAFGQLALAADGPHHAAFLRPGPGVSSSANPDATPTALSGMTAMSAINAAWPDFCGTGSATCASDPTGTILIGAPTELWSAATCTGTTTYCGEIYNVVVSNTATGDWQLELEVKQGTSVIYDSGLINEKETFPAGDIGLSYFEVAFGVGNCVTGVTCVAPKAGPATITYTNKLGKTTVTGTATITLQ